MGKFLQIAANLGILREREYKREHDCLLGQKIRNSQLVTVRAVSQSVKYIGGNVGGKTSFCTLDIVSERRNPL